MSLRYLAPAYQRALTRSWKSRFGGLERSWSRVMAFGRCSTAVRREGSPLVLNSRGRNRLNRSTVRGELLPLRWEKRSGPSEAIGGHSRRVGKGWTAEFRACCAEQRRSDRFGSASQGARTCICYSATPRDTGRATEAISARARAAWSHAPAASCRRSYSRTVEAPARDRKTRAHGSEARQGGSSVRSSKAAAFQVGPVQRHRTNSCPIAARAVGRTFGHWIPTLR